MFRPSTSGGVAAIVMLWLGLSGVVVGATPIVVDGVEYQRTGAFEGLTVPFDASNGVTLDTYEGLVEVEVSGTGESLDVAENDAFYVFSGPPPFYSGTPYHDARFYQLAIDTGTVVGFPPPAQLAKALIVYDLDASTETTPPYLPAYRADHTYRFVIDVAATSSWTGSASPLFFNVSDGNYSDNVGAYGITLYPLEPLLPPDGEPLLIQAAETPAGGTRVAVQVTGGTPGDTIPDIEILTAATCIDGFLDESATALGVVSNPFNELTSTTAFDADGNAFVIETLGTTGGQYASARLVNGAAAGDPSTCVVAGPDNDVWPRAKVIELGSTATSTATETGFIDVPGRARWYKFAVQPDAQVTIELSNLPANYDLYLFKDIAQAFADINSDNDTDALDRLGAEFASTVLNTTEISPFAFSPAEISPFAFSDAGLSPFAFSSSVYAGDAVAPFAFSGADNSSTAISPFAFSPFAFSPFAFSPFAFSPFAFSPFAFSDAYANAQTRSLIAVSARNGTSTERVSALTWSNTGDFYVLVAGRNGASDFDQDFDLGITYQGGLCAGVTPEDLASLDVGAPGNYRSIILYDSSRLANDGYPLSTQGPLRARLDALAARTEVDGVVVDLGALATIQMLHAQADASPSCPYAENLVAEAIKRVIDSYRAQNQDLAYVVLAGSDGQIPFFRYPDQTLLGPESNYEPPVRDLTQSQSALRKNYVLGQDQYGARTTLSLRDGRFPVPDLAVGRLVETPDEMIAMVDAYLSTEAGIVDSPTSTLVTGYDFLDDAANAIQNEFVAATNGIAGRRNETLIAANNLSPQDPASWNGAQLRQVLLDQAEDVVFLAGHFNAFSALAADYTTTLDTTELLASTTDLTNVLVFSAGCHSGYNAVNEEQVAGLPPDWAQAFARKGATFIGGTGYQYGDTEFIEFGERLYLEFAKKLRTGDGPVAIGDALMAAKRQYLKDEADVKGLHRKSLLISTLFGLPMLKIDMPGDRIPNETGTSVVDPADVVDLSLSGTPSPGRTLGLKFYDLTNSYSLTEVTKPLTVYGPGGATSTVTASYLTGLDGLIINPGEPVVPRRSQDVSLAGESLRGVGFRGGAWSEAFPVIPLVGAATTELRAPQTRFASLDFYPMRLARANYFDALSGSGKTILHTTPVQHRTEQIGADATRRVFADQEFRLYYSSNTQSYVTSGGSVNIPALSAAPSFTNIRVEIDGNDVLFGAQVVGDPASGIQEVWVTWTDGSQSSGVWAPLDLTQSASDSRRWTGRLVGGAVANDRIDAVFHAVNGVGLVTTDDNFGRYHQAVTPGDPAVVTALEFVDPMPPAPGSAPPSAPNGSEVAVSVRLTEQPMGNTIADRTVVFALGSSIRSASTNGSGIAQVNLPIVSTPGDYPLTATFDGDPATLGGDPELLASSVEQRFRVTRSGSDLTLSVAAPTVAVNGVETGVSARLTADDPAQTPLIERTVFFTVTGGPDGAVTVPKITNQLGVASLGELALPAGTYGVEARYLGVIPGVLNEITDPVYEPSFDSGSMTLANGPGCPTSSTNGKINVIGFCYLTGEVDGKISITDGTLFIGGSTQIVNPDESVTIVNGVYVDQKIDQYGDGGVIIMAGAGVRGQIKEFGNGGIRVAGDVGGNLTESGPGGIVITPSGTISGNLSESDTGDVRVAGSVDGNVTEAGAGSLTVAEGGTIDGHATETGPGLIVNDGTVTKTITQD